MKLGRYYLLQFGFLYHYLAPKIQFLSIFSFTYLHLPINWPDLNICAIFNLDMYYSIEAAPLCQILEQSDNYSWRECSLGVYLVIDNYLYVPSNALPLYHI